MKRILSYLAWKLNSAAVVCLAVVAAHLLWSRFTGASVNYLQCLVQIIFVGIIFIWKYGMLTLKSSFHNMGAFFKGSAYEDVYREFTNKLLWTGFDTHNKGLILAAIKYFVVWMAVWLYLLYQLVYYKLFSSDMGGMASAFLFSIAMLLNGISYHSCIHAVIFVKKISDLPDSKFKTMQYNRYLPSTTLDFQKLISNTDRGLTFFWLASLLFSIEYTVLIFNNAGDFKEQLEESPQHFYFTTMMVLFLGLMTFLGIYFLPIVFFKKIVKRWKEYSMAEFEAELAAAEAAGDACLIEKAITKIERVDHNQIKFDYPIVNLIVALSTLLINAVNIIVSVPYIYELVLKAG